MCCAESIFFAYCLYSFYILSNSLFQGDFLVHFMDIARDELTKKLEEISVEKLQVAPYIFLLKGKITEEIYSCSR